MEAQKGKQKLYVGTNNAIQRLPKDLLTAANSKNWKLSVEQFSLDDLHHFFSLLEESRIHSLNLGYNQDPLVIKTISVCLFPQIEQLNLYCNSIDSIEQLCEVSMPNLRSIRLDFNQLHSIRPLQKCYIPNIESIDLRNVMVKEGDNIIHDLTFGQLNCPHLASVWTEGEWYEGVQAQSHRWIIKINSEDLLDYYCLRKPSHREAPLIFEPQLIKCLRKRFPKLKLNRYSIPPSAQEL